MNQIYIPVRDFPNYCVSNIGTVKNLKSGKILKPQMTKKGLQISIVNDYEEEAHYYLDRLVAIHFVPNPNKFINLIHINGDILNNNANNLRYIAK